MGIGNLNFGVVDWQGSSASVKRAPINVSASGDQIVLPAVTGKILVPVAMLIMAAGDVNVIVKSGTTVLSGPMPLAAQGGFQLPFNQMGYLPTAKGEAWVLNLSAAVQVSGFLQYLELNPIET